MNNGLQLSKFAPPIIIMLILAMMILPLPPFVLDILFTFNISVAVIVLMVSLYTMKPLDFSVFPTVLLITTMLRLSLNVASTRIVLLNGNTGPAAAGHVIEAFGHFLVRGNYTVGLVVFLILVIINFVVITKGAGRIAEVSARFTLDAMPGKQMAIDADLNAGLIGESEARSRRSEISQEADFYGSMDGASKFVRGDAVAGIIIVAINIIGGLAVGVIQHGMTVAQAFNNYTLLAIGDGLVAQIPALVISTAAGLMVSRVTTNQDIGEQLHLQLFSRPRVLGLAGAVLGLLGIIPGMPNMVFLMFAVALGFSAWVTHSNNGKQEAQPDAKIPEPVDSGSASVEVSWNDVSPIDVVSLEVGYRLIALVDQAQDGELLRRIRGIRKKFAQEFGFLVAPVHIRDNLELKLNAYRIALKGVELGSGEIQPGQYLAINPGRILAPLPGIATTDPTFGLPALWIESSLREQAQSLGYTVVDASTVVATHLSQIFQVNAAELLGREEVQQLLDHTAKTYPKLVEDLVPKLLPLSVLQKVLQRLLEERLNIRDIRTILETLAEHASRISDPEELTAKVREAMGRSIIQQIFGGARELPVIALDGGLEKLLMQIVQNEVSALEPGLAENIMRQTHTATEQLERQGLIPALITPPPLRPFLARFLRRALPQLHVISHGEIPDAKIIKVSAILGGSR
ncbi:MAG: flagellar biosynthesis protein FlhA [Proteobacteria bacterium]|nr:flagellar biosynthesis protein FlhA [Pseudomonadota bacterium]